MARPIGPHPATTRVRKRGVKDACCGTDLCPTRATVRRCSGDTVLGALPQYHLVSASLCMARPIPRVGQVKPSDDERLTDRIAIGVLTSVFPPALVDDVLETAGRVQKRHRLLPARVVVYFTLAMCLWADEEYVEVARLLVGGVKSMARWRGSWRVPTSGAITQARARLGSSALKLLFERVAAPISSKGAAGSWWRGLRLVAIDGTVFDLPDTPANDARFGRPGSGRGEAKGAFPQARVVALAECGTHAIIGAQIGPCTTGETTLARGLLGLLDPEMLLLVDRGFPGYELWREAAATRAQLC